MNKSFSFFNYYLPLFVLMTIAVAGITNVAYYRKQYRELSVINVRLTEEIIRLTNTVNSDTLYDSQYSLFLLNNNIELRYQLDRMSKPEIRYIQNPRPTPVFSCKN